MNLASEAKLLKRSPRHLCQDTLDLAAGVVFGSKSVYASIFSHIIHSINEQKMVPLACYRTQVYDETPMRPRGSATRIVARASGAESALGNAAKPTGGIQTWKFFQCEVTLAVLVNCKVEVHGLPHTHRLDHRRPLHRGGCRQGALGPEPRGLVGEPLQAFPSGGGNSTTRTSRCRQCKSSY